MIVNEFPNVNSQPSNCTFTKMAENAATPKRDPLVRHAIDANMMAAITTPHQPNSYADFKKTLTPASPWTEAEPPPYPHGKPARISSNARNQ